MLKLVIKQPSSTNQTEDSVCIQKNSSETYTSSLDQNDKSELDDIISCLDENFVRVVVGTRGINLKDFIEIYSPDKPVPTIRRKHIAQLIATLGIEVRKYSTGYRLIGVHFKT